MGRCFCVETFQSRDAVLPPYDQGGVTASLQSFKSRFSSSSSSSSSSSLCVFGVQSLRCCSPQQGGVEDRIAIPCVSHPFHCLGCPVAAFKAATAVAVFGSVFVSAHPS